jgi:hypothetical protein
VSGGHGGRRDGAGRPVGSISKTTAELKTLAQQHGAAIITKLAELAGVLPGNAADSHAVQVQAMRELLDRGFGRSTQPLSGDTEAAPLNITFHWADAVPEQQPEPELDDAATEAGALGFVATSAGESIC